MASPHPFAGSSSLNGGGRGRSTRAGGRAGACAPGGPVPRAGAPSGTLPREQAERLTAEVAVLVAADALGAAQWMLDTTVEYVKERKQFGVAVGSFQAVKHYAAQMIVPIEATRAAVSYAAWALDEGEDDAVLHAWIAKAYAADHLNDVADKALFLHGAIGYTWEHDLQLPFKRVKADAQIAGGAAGYHDRVAALVGLTAETVAAS